MRNPFDRATEISIRHPKIVLSVGLVVTLMLSSMAMFLEFDNSEDAFFPDNETVRLLDEVESEYHASIDFVRVIVRSDTGLSDPSTWSHLGAMESFSSATKTCPLLIPTVRRSTEHRPSKLSDIMDEVPEHG